METAKWGGASTKEIQLRLLLVPLCPAVLVPATASRFRLSRTEPYESATNGEPRRRVSQWEKLDAGAGAGGDRDLARSICTETQSPAPPSPNSPCCHMPDQHPARPFAGCQLLGIAFPRPRVISIRSSDSRVLARDQKAGFDAGQPSIPLTPGTKQIISPPSPQLPPDSNESTIDLESTA